MSLGEDLSKEVAAIFSSRWSERDGTKIPESSDIQLGNDAVKLSGTVLYADLADSTALVDKYKPAFAAEIYTHLIHQIREPVEPESLRRTYRAVSDAVRNDQRRLASG